ncbi:MAG: O-methyltransferase [Muribaculaceae bacterium]|nr:O-methyltransferase [Muribaculaceae bacterium]
MTEDDYIAAHIDAEPAALRALYRHTHLHRLYPRMCTDHIQGRLLVMLTRMIRPRHILELGTFTGYSTLCFAEGMPQGCTIDTVELDPDYADDLRELFADTAPGKDISLHIGDAEELLPGLLARRSYDMVFVDANKRRYPQYYELLAKALPEGAYILADNTLWTDKVLDPEARDPQTEGIRRFNDIVAADPTVEKVILPVRDGLTIIRKKFSNFAE